MSSTRSRPTDAALALVLAAILALPVASAAGLTGVGGYRMFTDPVTYRIELRTVDPRGLERHVGDRELLPHVGRDARRVLSRLGQERTGEVHAELVARGAHDLAVLACALHPGAARAVVDVERRDARGRPLPVVHDEVRCDAAAAR